MNSEMMTKYIESLSTGKDKFLREAGWGISESRCACCCRGREHPRLQFGRRFLSTRGDLVAVYGPRSAHSSAFEWACPGFLCLVARARRFLCIFCTESFA